MGCRSGDMGDEPGVVGRGDVGVVGNVDDSGAIPRPEDLPDRLVELNPSLLTADGWG